MPQFYIMNDQKSNANWRNDPGLKCEVVYKKKLAWVPITCSDGTRVWLTYYFKKYNRWLSGYATLYDFNYHTDFVENVSEAEYITRILAEKF